MHLSPKIRVESPKWNFSRIKERERRSIKRLPLPFSIPAQFLNAN